MKDQLHILEKIETVDAPPFLFTRIQAKIQEQLADKLTTKQAIAYLAGLAFIVVLNVLVLKQSSDQPTESDLVSELNLAPANQLYE